MPADKASMLSSILKELIKATIHSTDSSHVTSGTLIKAVSRQSCKVTQAAATPNWTASRIFQPSPQRSSSSPRTINTVPAANKIHRRGDWASKPATCGRASAGSHWGLTTPDATSHNNT